MSMASRLAAGEENNRRLPAASGAATRRTDDTRKGPVMAIRTDADAQAAALHTELACAWDEVLDGVMTAPRPSCMRKLAEHLIANGVSIDLGRQ